MKRKKGKKVTYHKCLIKFIAWEMLVKKMEKMNLSESEQELIK
jgi:hypothetical protein